MSDCAGDGDTAIEVCAGTPPACNRQVRQILAGENAVLRVEEIRFRGGHR